MNILEIGSEMEAMLADLEENGGEMLPEVEAWFNQLEKASTDKMDNIAATIRDCQLIAAACKEEEERYRKRREVKENIEKRLKDLLKFHLGRLGMKKVETDRFLLSVCTNGGPQPIEITCEPNQLPPKFQRHKIEADYRGIQEVIAAGQEVKGVKVLERGSHLRLK